MASDYNNVIATIFPEHANALAAEIAQSGLALVGLQEVALWQTQGPYGSGTWTPDLLQILRLRQCEETNGVAPSSLRKR